MHMHFTRKEGMCWSGLSGYMGWKSHSNLAKGYFCLLELRKCRAGAGAQDLYTCRLYLPVGLFMCWLHYLWMVPLKAEPETQTPPGYCINVLWLL